MTAELYWVTDIQPARLALTPCPQPDVPLAATIDAWRDAGIKVVVSLIEDREATMLGLDQEAALCTSRGLGFVSLPIRDRDVPDSEPAVRELSVFIVERLRAGDGVAIHCRGGIGRTGVVAGAVLALMGFDADRAIRSLTRSRGVNMPQTKRQDDWIRTFADRIARESVADADMRMDDGTRPA